MMKIFLMMCLLVIGLLTTSFLFFNSQHCKYEDIALEIRSKIGKKLVEKHHMFIVGISAGMIKMVNRIGLSFQMNRPMSRDEARYRLIDCVEEILKAFNENEEIRPYLKNYPFTVCNLNIDIFMTDENGGRIYDPHIDVISINESHQICYRIKSPDYIPYKHKYTESYEEALAIVKANPEKYPLGFSSCTTAPKRKRVR